MKLRLVFKTPDVIDEMWNEYYEALIEKFSPIEMDELYHDLKKWIKYGEILTVEYDTDSKEMKVIEVH